MKIKIFAFLIIFLFSEKSFSQDTKAEKAMYNVEINAVFSGIGALINKKPNEK